MYKKMMDEEALVSVIIPVYNGEKYVAACLDSVLGQTYKNLQIIIVNDGSVDGTEAILKKYAAMDDRIELIMQNNQGVSAARNHGLEYVKGTYICMVDCDDLLPQQSIEIRVNRIEDSDLLIEGYSRIDENGNILYRMPDGKQHVWSRGEAVKYMLKYSEYGYQGWPVNKLFRTEIIEKNKIQFDKGIAYNEDRLFVVKYIMNCEKVSIYSDDVYTIIEHADSAMGAVRNIKKEKIPLLLTEITAFERICELLKAKSDKKNYYLACMCVLQKTWQWYYKVKNVSPEYCEQLKKKNTYYSKIMFHAPLSDVDLKLKLKVFIHWVLKREYGMV